MDDFLSRIARRIGKDAEDEAYIRAFIEHLEDPRDQKRLHNYFEWLQSHGDVRGEYIALYNLGTDIGEEQLARREELRARIDPLWAGFILREAVPGIVTRISDEAFYVALGELEGEAHIRDMSW